MYRNEATVVREVQGSPAEDSWSGMERCAVIVSWIFSLGVWFFLVTYAYCKTRDEEPGKELSKLCTGFALKPALFWPIFAVSYVVYFINAATSPVRKYLSNQLQETCKDYLAKLVATAPMLMWHIQCYHYETRTTTDSKGHTHTRQVRVNTHSATGSYSYASWRDVSGTIQIPMGPNLLRMRLEKDKRFADAETQEDYTTKFGAWVAANDRDVYKDVSEYTEIAGFEDYVLSRERGSGGMCSCCIGSGFFWIATILSFNIIYAHIFFCTTSPFDVTVLKEISSHHQAPPVSTVYDAGASANPAYGGALFGAPTPGYPIEATYPPAGPGYPPPTGYPEYPQTDPAAETPPGYAPSLYGSSEPPYPPPPPPYPPPPPPYYPPPPSGYPAAGPEKSAA